MTHSDVRRIVVPATPSDFLSREQCQVLLDQCVAFGAGGGETSIAVNSEWNSGSRWARSRSYLAYDVHATTLDITRTIRGATGSATTTRLDASGLRRAVQAAERNLLYTDEAFELLGVSRVADPIAAPVLWSDATYALRGDARGALVRDLLESVGDAGLVVAGELRVAAGGYGSLNSMGAFRYYPHTVVDFSVTVRNTAGTGSGWAGVDDYDVGRIDVVALTTKARDKCLASVGPIAIEPGRYTVILEPQAVADFFQPLVVGRALDRSIAEMGMGPFAGPAPGTSKIGDAVLDPRMTLSADPMDILGGFIPFRRSDGTPYDPVKWIDRGELNALAYGREYALSRLGRAAGLLNSYSFHISGGTTALDDMIASTERGLLVTRFSNVIVVDFSSMLLSGFTRDGLWLVEHGRITKSVKNFRFVESPLFAFNALEQLGPPQRVRSAKPGEWAWVAPPAKVRDFHFSSVADAV